MEGTENGVIEWRIENLSHWCKEVHGKGIESPIFGFECVDGLNMTLYPKGISGERNYMVVRMCGDSENFSGDLSFYYSNGPLFFNETVNVECNLTAVEIEVGGVKLADVLTRIREEGSEDFITVRCRRKYHTNYERRICTTINVLKASLKINPRWIEKMKSNETKSLFYIQMSPNDNLARMHLKTTCSENNTVQFKISPPATNEPPFAVEMSMSVTGSDGTFDSCVKEEHVFRERGSPWTFPGSLEKNELVDKGITLAFCLKTRNSIKSPFYMNSADSCVSIESNNALCFFEKKTPTDPVTEDSGAVLAKDLLCLYQADKEFSDFQLKCGNVSFPVHKAVLSARSPVFKAMLSNDMKEAASGKVDIEDLDPSILANFLTYLYTGAMEDLQCDGALKLYYAADKYQVPSLKRECVQFLSDNVSISNVCDILSFANKYQDEELTAVSHNFILCNYNAVLGSEEWNTLKSSEPLLAVDTVTQFAVEDRVRKHRPQ